MSARRGWSIGNGIWHSAFGIWHLTLSAAARIPNHRHRRPLAVLETCSGAKRQRMAGEWSGMRKRRTVIIVCGACLVAAAAAVIAWRTWWREPERLCIPASLLRIVERNRHGERDALRRPVPLDILVLNPKRKAVGLREIGEGWTMAGPLTMAAGLDYLAVVILDRDGNSAKVVEQESGRDKRGKPPPKRLHEHEVRDGRLNGLAARWVGNELLLERTEQYQNNHRISATYYSPEGQVMASCTFRRDWTPWDGHACTHARPNPNHTPRFSSDFRNR